MFPIEDQDSQIAGIGATLVDITATKQALEALRKSEAVNRAILNAIPDAMFRTRIDGTFIDFIPAKDFELLVPPTEFLGKKVSEVLPHSLALAITHSIEQVKATGAADVFEYQLLLNGIVRDYEARTVVCGSDEVLSIVRDISDRKQAMAALSESEQRFRATFEQAAVGIVHTQLDGKLLRVNQKFCDILGYTREEMQDLTVQEITHPSDLDADTASWRSLLAGEIPTYSMEKRYFRKDGGIVWVNLTVSLVLSVTGVPLYAIAVIQDISDRKQSEESLLRVTQAVESASDAIAIADVTGTHIYQNQAFLTLFEYTVAQLNAAGGPPVVFVDPAVARQVLDTVLRGHSWRGEVQMLSRTGRIIPILLRGDAIFDASGNLVGLLGIFTDITARKQASESLRQSEERFRKIFEVGPLGMALVGENYRFLKVNSRLCQMLGYTEAELTALTCPEITHPEDVETDIRLAQLVFGGEIPSYTIQKRYVKKNQQMLWVILRACAIRDRDGQTLYRLAMIEDITHRKQVEEEICSLNAMLEQRVADRTAELVAANKELEAFCYSVSHDLRSPLRSIQGFSEALLEDYYDVLDSTGIDYLRRVCAATERMGQLIDNLLGLSRVTRTPMHRQQVNLSEMAIAIACELQLTSSDRQVEFNIAEDIVAIGDPQLLRVMLENLLNNAWKFTSKQTNARIEFGVTHISSEDGRGLVAPTDGGGNPAPTGLWTYFVRDNGAGFNMEYADKLFAPFQRLHKTSEFEGTGIGLATVWRIIHRHGGFVWATGAVGQGATFYFTLDKGDIG